MTGCEALEDKGHSLALLCLANKRHRSPSPTKHDGEDGAAVEEGRHVQGLGDLGAECQGASTQAGSAGEDGAADEERRRLQSMGEVAWQCHGAAAATGSAGEDCAADAKCGTVQSMGPMGIAMETG